MIFSIKKVLIIKSKKVSIVNSILLIKFELDLNEFVIFFLNKFKKIFDNFEKMNFVKKKI